MARRGCISALEAHTCRSNAGFDSPPPPRRIRGGLNVTLARGRPVMVARDHHAPPSPRSCLRSTTGRMRVSEPESFPVPMPLPLTHSEFSARFSRLTMRQQSIIRCMAVGEDGVQVADRFFRNHKTIKEQPGRAYKALGIPVDAHGKMNLTAYYLGFHDAWARAHDRKEIA